MSAAGEALRTSSRPRRPWLWLVATVPTGLGTFGGALMIAAVALALLDAVVPGEPGRPLVAGIAFGFQVALWGLATAVGLILLGRWLVDPGSRPDRSGWLWLALAVAVAAPLMAAVIVWFRGRGLDADQVGLTFALPYLVVVLGLSAFSLRLWPDGVPAAFRLIHLAIAGAAFGIVALAALGARDGIRPDSVLLAGLVAAAGAYALLAATVSPRGASAGRAQGHRG